MPTWMVVEDEPDLYDTLLMLFEIWGVDGVAFTSGTDAIRWIEEVDRGLSDSGIPELALLDIRLPGATGPEIGERLRQSPTLREMAIVLTTAYHLTPQEERAAIAQAAADALIRKPLPRPADLRLMLQDVIDQRRAHPAGPPALLRGGHAPAPTAPQSADRHSAPARLASSTPAARRPPPVRRLTGPPAAMPQRDALPRRRQGGVRGWLARLWRWLRGGDRE